MHLLAVCEKSGLITGIQFVLRSTTDRNVLDALSPVGQVMPSCKAIELAGPVERVRVSYIQLGVQSITGIEFTRGGQTKKFGTIDPMNVKSWNFGVNSKLMGVHGRINEESGVITQLGFVVLDESMDDSVCSNDAEVKYFGEETQEEVTNEVTDVFMNEEEDDTEMEVSIKPQEKSWLIEIVIVTVVAILLCAILVLCIIRRKAKNENKHTTVI